MCERERERERGMEGEPSGVTGLHWQQSRLECLVRVYKLEKKREREREYTHFGWETTLIWSSGLMATTRPMCGCYGEFWCMLIRLIAIAAAARQHSTDRCKGRLVGIIINRTKFTLSFVTMDLIVMKKSVHNDRNCN